MKNYVLAMIGCGLLALISAFYYLSSRPTSQPTSPPSIALAASSLSTATQSESIVKPKVVGPGNIVVGPKQMVVDPSVQATAPATNAEQTKASLSGYDKLCNQLAGDSNKTPRSDICMWRKQLKSESREEPWASETEAVIRDCVEALLASNSNLARPQRIECRRSGCEVQSFVTGEARSFIFGSPAAMCNSSAFQQLLTAAGNGCTASDGQGECSNFFSRRDYAPNTEIDGSPLPTVLNPVRVADGFEKILKPQFASSTVQATEGNRLHRLLESELRDEAWATYVEQKVSRYVDSYLGQRRVEQDALVLHVVACGKTMCEVQVSVSTKAMRNPTLDWQPISQQMVKDVLAKEISGNSTLVTTLSNGRAGFVSFYRRRK